MNDVDQVFIPKLRGFEEEANQNIANAQVLISSGGSKELLLANISTGKSTIEACRVFADILQSQRRTIAYRNRETQQTLADAAHTYKTVILSIDVAGMIGQCQAAFKALRELKLPQLRTFQNLQLKGELERLAARIVDKEQLMSWSFRKSLRLLPGIRINLSKSGPRLSVGVPGARASINMQGKTRIYGGTGPLRFQKTLTMATSQKPQDILSRLTAVIKTGFGKRP